MQKPENIFLSNYFYWLDESSAHKKDLVVFKEKKKKISKLKLSLNKLYHEQNFLRNKP